MDACQAMLYDVVKLHLTGQVPAWYSCSPSKPTMTPAKDAEAEHASAFEETLHMADADCNKDLVEGAEGDVDVEDEGRCICSG